MKKGQKRKNNSLSLRAKKKQNRDGNPASLSLFLFLSSTITSAASPSPRRRPPATSPQLDRASAAAGSAQTRSSPRPTARPRGLSDVAPPAQNRHARRLPDPLRGRGVALREPVAGHAGVEVVDVVVLDPQQHPLRQPARHGDVGRAPQRRGVPRVSGGGRPVAMQGGRGRRAGGRRSSCPDH